MGFTGALFFLQRSKKDLPTSLKICYPEISYKLLRERTLVSMKRGSLLFLLDNTKTCDTRKSEEMWFNSCRSGLDKSQSTVQLTVFGDGISKIQLTSISRARRKRTKLTEGGSWDKRVKVSFQEKVLCDEVLNKKWIRDEWVNIFKYPPAIWSTRKILLLMFTDPKKLTT